MRIVKLIFNTTNMFSALKCAIYFKSYSALIVPVYENDFSHVFFTHIYYVFKSIIRSISYFLDDIKIAIDMFRIFF